MFITVTRRLLVPALLACGSTAMAAPLDLDASFGSSGLASQPYPSGITTTRRSIVATDSNNRPYVVAQQFNNENVTSTVWYIGRLTSSGQPDSGFGTAGWISISGPITFAASGLCVDNLSGDLALVGEVGSTGQMAAIRVNAAGVPRADWGTQGLATVPNIHDADAALGCSFDSTGRLLLAGYDYQYNPNNGVSYNSALIVRLGTAGQVDSSFASGGLLVAPAANADSIYYTVSVIAEARDGSLFVGGAATQNGSARYPSQVLLMKLSSAGGLVTSFGGTGVLVASIGDATTVLGAIRPQYDGSAVVTAAQNLGSGGPTALIGRVTANGTLDSSYSYVRIIDLSRQQAESDALTIDAAGHFLLSGDYYPSSNSNGPAPGTVGVYRLAGTPELSSAATTTAPSTSSGSGSSGGGGALSPGWLAFAGLAALRRRRGRRSS